MSRLEHYPWPGNVRELQNVLERAAVLSPGPMISIPELFRLGATRAAADFLTLDDAERAHIREALRRTDGVIHGPNGAAALLAIKPTTLRSRMERLGIANPRGARS